MSGVQRFLAGWAASVGCIVLAAATPVGAQQPSISGLAEKIPSSANAVMVVNVQRIRDSAIAKNEGWFASVQGRVDSGMNFLPDGVNLILLSSRLDYQAVHPLWGAVLVTMDQAPAIDALRELLKGTLDEYLGASFVETPTDRFVMVVDPATVAAYHPALRPDFVRWVPRLLGRDTAQVADYLKEGLGFSEELGTELIAAFDLSHMTTPARVLDRIRDSEVLKAKGLLPRDVARVIGSVRGLTLGVTVRDKLFASVKIDFGEDVSILAPVAKDLVAEVMRRSAVEIEEFADWTPELKGNSIYIRGDFSKSSWRRVLSILEPPSPETYAAVPAAETGPAAANQSYFLTVNSLVEDVRPKLNRGESYGDNASWLRKFADRIDSLPIAGVDEELLAYGNYVSDALRTSASLLINTRETAAETQRNMLATDYRSNYWGYGYYDGVGYGRSTSNKKYRHAEQENFKADAVKSLNQVFEDLATRQRDMRQALTKKYSVEF